MDAIKNPFKTKKENIHTHIHTHTVTFKIGIQRKEKPRITVNWSIKVFWKDLFGQYQEKSGDDSIFSTEGELLNIYTLQ